jgi:RNA methyltransferase, TrmH family
MSLPPSLHHAPSLPPPSLAAAAHPVSQHPPMRIHARSNPWVQQWLRYQAKPALRKAAGLVWLEGEHLLIEAFNRLAASHYGLDTLVFPDNAIGQAMQQRLSSQYAAAGSLNTVYLGDSAYKALTSVDSPPSVCAVLRVPCVGMDQSGDVGGDSLRTLVNFSQTAVVLDGVQDPGNIGAIVRLCAAFAVPQLLLSAGCASAWSAKALRAGQGAQLALSIVEDVDLNRAYAAFAAAQLPIVATSLSGNSVALNAATLPTPMVWVFGSEGQGISSATQLAATQCVHIPMQGGFESLNVGNAAAIALWQWQSQGLNGAA